MVNDSALLCLVPMVLMIVNTLLCLVPMVLCFCHANLALVDASLNKLGCFSTFWLVKGVVAVGRGEHDAQRPAACCVA
jgi:hypothetical protein